MIDNFSKYFEGVGANIDNVYYIRLQSTANDEVPAHDHFQKVRKRLSNMNSVDEVSLSYYGPPYVMGYSSKMFKYGEKLSKGRVRYADEHFPSVMQPELVDGQWFSGKNQGSIEIPVVIDRNMAEKLFEGKDPVGKVIEGDDKKFKITGVISHFKNSDYDRSGPVIFMPFTSPKIDIYDQAEFLIRIKEGHFPHPADYSKKIFSVLSKDSFKLSSCSTVASMKEKANSNIGGDMAFVSLIVGFLLFNLILGLIGILGYNVNQRWSEMGIRRAVGATKVKVRRLIFFEMTALTVMAILPALIVVIQIPAFKIMPLDWGLFIGGMGASLLLIFTLVFISVLYPGIMAAKIRPAIALKEE
jgi:putative ABC transport system permease protein